MLAMAFAGFIREGWELGTAWPARQVRPMSYFSAGKTLQIHN
jgi:hypothetical protein